MSTDKEPRTVSLNVVDDKPRKRVGHSRMGKRRAAVLIAVHVLIIAHVAHWIASGRTLSPVEPSESMETLEKGLVNAGAIFFALAILSTLIFGRFFCGWACHVVALQDLCAWIMKKCGVRPVPFRSRLLPLIPVGLAIYMFAWPTLLKVVIEPAFDTFAPSLRPYLGNIAALPTEFQNELVQNDFWATFPTVAVAIPFLFVCGFATVYFLGAKGFCTYGCPYGGVFGPVDKISPGRIVVDHDKCQQSGHCTAVCTSNVRVHDEIREYGMVVDPGCMKCMDCVSVCPNDALSFSFSKPPVAKGKPRNKKPKRKYDTTILGDIALLLVFLITFYVSRGTYPVIPMLFAVGIGGCCMFIAYKAWGLVTRPNVRLVSFQLKKQKKLTATGAAFALATLALTVLAVHTGWVKLTNNRANAIATELNLNKASFLTPQPRFIHPDRLDKIERAREKFAAAAAFGDGGKAIMNNPEARMRYALLSLAAGEYDVAETYLRTTIEQNGPTNDACLDLAELLICTGRRSEAFTLMDQWLAEDPTLWRIRDARDNDWRRTGRLDDAITDAQAALNAIGDGIPERAERLRTRHHLARILAWQRQADGAEEQYRAILAEDPDGADARDELVRLLASTGRVDEALELATGALDVVTRREATRRAHLTLARLHAELGNATEAEQHYRNAVDVRDTDVATRREACGYLEQRQPERALELARDGLEDVPDRFRYRAVRNDIRTLIAELLTRAGRSDEAVEAWKAVIENEPHHPAAAVESLCLYLMNLNRADEAFTVAEDAHTSAEDPVTIDRLDLLITRLHMIQNNADLAEERLRSVLERQPQAWDAREVLCNLIASQGRAQEAIQLCRDALEALPDAPAIAHGRARTWLLLAAMLNQNQERTAALEAVATAVGIAPHVVPYRLMYADALRSLALDYDGAREQCIVACDLAALQIEPWFQLGYTDLLAGRDDDAEAAFRVLLNLNPYDPMVRQQIEQTYGSLGKQANWLQQNDSSSGPQQP